MQALYSAYCFKQGLATERLSELSKKPTVMQWLSECRQQVALKTHAWDLPSLLIKPVQRILKYSLLLKSMLETMTDFDVGRKMMEQAILTTEYVAERINQHGARRGP